MFQSILRKNNFRIDIVSTFICNFFFFLYRLMPNFYIAFRDLACFPILPVQLRGIQIECKSLVLPTRSVNGNFHRLLIKTVFYQSRINGLQFIALNINRLPFLNVRLKKAFIKQICFECHQFILLQSHFRLGIHSLKKLLLYEITSACITNSRQPANLHMKVKNLLSHENTFRTSNSNGTMRYEAIK